jgi:MinD-like ATPase involved in chromosome partitioning or flagellar assembly
MLKLSKIFENGKVPEVQPGEPIGVLVAAPPDQARPFMELGPNHPSGVHVLATTRDAADLADDIRNFKPQVVIISPEIRNYTAEIVARISKWPDFPVAVIGLASPSGAWGAEMTSLGAIAFYTVPVTPGVVEQFVREARGHVAQARLRWTRPLVDGEVGWRPVSTDAASAGYRTGAIACWSTKGGDGKTTLAVNMACLLSVVAGRSVLLIDADMNCGRVALHLDIPPAQNTILHLASDYQANGNKLEAEMLRKRVITADAALDPRTRQVEGRLYVLFGIINIQHGSSGPLFGRQGQQFMTDLIRLAREQYDFVIVDLGSNTQMGPHFGALQAADQVLFINTSDRSSLYHNRQTYQALVEKADLRPDKFKLVMNRYDPDDRIDLKDVAEFMGLPVFSVVPEDRSRNVIASVNQGRPFALQFLHKSPAGAENTLRGMMSVAEGLYPPIGKQLDIARTSKGKGSGMFGLFGGKK